ncbi:MAG TPA: adenylate/guanylate cyclase domain-containing protein, partial [Candidatus Binataceae bacterium]|nr:adenylate/guanylate cyclase domain-containing protein [Candidatus Binataceae bacterium]
VMALFIRGICGPDYHRRAVEAASALLGSLGYGRAEKPWLAIGGAVHSGLAYVGNVGGEVVDFTALGDTVNTAARLAASAGSGEVLLSDPVHSRVGGSLSDLERRTLTLRGKELPVDAWVLGLNR